MAKTDIYDPDICISPCFAIDRWNAVVAKYGAEVALKKSKFKPEREAWITALFFLGLMSVENKEYWIAINSEDTTPDTYGIEFEAIPNGIHRKITNIEVFEWEQHSKESLIDAIKKKLEKKYPKNYVLLCYIHGRFGERVNLKELTTAVSLLKPNVAQIILVGSQVGATHDHKMMLIHGGSIAIDFSYEIEYQRRKDQKQILKHVRGSGTKFTPMGIIEIPLP